MAQIDDTTERPSPRQADVGGVAADQLRSIVERIEQIGRAHV